MGLEGAGGKLEAHVSVPSTRQEGGAAVRHVGGKRRRLDFDGSRARAAPPPRQPPQPPPVGGVGVSTCSSSSCAGRVLGRAQATMRSRWAVLRLLLRPWVSDEIAGMSKGSALQRRAAGHRVLSAARPVPCSHLGVPSSSDAYEP